MTLGAADRTRAGLFRSGGRPGRHPRAAPASGQGDAQAAGPARILIAEDEWFIAVESESALRDAGLEVVGIAVSADEAVALAESRGPDLVLMDIRLRGARDGIDAAQEIRERFGIACLFATAHSEEGVRGRAEAARPAGWLTKPFSDKQLVAAVRAALEG